MDGVPFNPNGKPRLRFSRSIYRVFAFLSIVVHEVRPTTSGRKVVDRSNPPRGEIRSRTSCHQRCGVDTRAVSSYVHTADIVPPWTMTPTPSPIEALADSKPDGGRDTLWGGHYTAGVSLISTFPTGRELETTRFAVRG